MSESLIWLIPAAVAIAGLVHPRAGILVFLFGLPFFGAPPGGPYLAALDVAALAVIVTGWRYGRSFRSCVDGPAWAFVLVTAASLLPLAYRPPTWRVGGLLDLFAHLPEAQRWTVFYSWRALANCLLGWLLFVTVRRAFARSSPRPLGAALGAGLFLSLVIGYLEFGGAVDLWGYRPIGLQIFDQRFHSLFFHSGWLAEYLALATPFAVAALLVAPGKGIRRASGALLVLVLGALLFSGQRGAWYAVLAQLLAAVVFAVRSGALSRKWWRQALIGAVAIALLVAAGVILRPEAGGALKHRLQQATKNLSNRSWVWRASAETAIERPLLGWGVGTFSPVFDLEATPGEEHQRHWLTAHNTYIMLLVERGLLGIAALGLLGWAVLRTLRTTAGGEDRERRLLALGLGVSGVGFVVYGLVQYLFFPRVNEYLFWVLLGAVATLGGPQEGRRFRRLQVAVLAAALLWVPVRFAAFESAPPRGSGSYGLHASEGRPKARFQWTTGHAVQRLPWQGETLVLALANGHPHGAQRPLRVEVLVDGAVVEQLIIVGGWEEHRIYLGQPSAETIVLEVDVDRTFRPFSDYLSDPSLPRSRDIRRLGVAVGEIRWE